MNNKINIKKKIMGKTLILSSKWLDTPTPIFVIILLKRIFLSSLSLSPSLINNYNTARNPELVSYRSDSLSVPDHFPYKDNLSL